MIQNHVFLTQSANWLGEGEVTLNLVEEPMKFYSRWSVTVGANKEVECLQQIEIVGMADHVHNLFSFNFSKGDEIYVQMENNAIGRVKAKGLCDDKVVAWEYENPLGGFGGYELYKKEDDNTYLFRCEFLTKEQLRSHIQGKMWLDSLS